MKLVAWLQRDPYAALSSRLRALPLDYGRGFESELVAGPTRSTLTVTSCFYQRLFEAEGAGQLTACCCCSQDRVWLEGAPRKGVASGLESCIAQGDPRCRYFVEKVAG